MDELYYPPGFEKQNKVFCLSIGQNKRRMYKMVEQSFFGKRSFGETLCPFSEQE